MIEFLWGLIAGLCAVAGLFFFKFWRQTRDTLFMSFAVGFGFLALHYGGLGLIHPRNEAQHYLFFMRLVAFGFMIGGVVAKNRQTPAPPGAQQRSPKGPR